MEPVALQQRHPRGGRYLATKINCGRITQLAHTFSHC